MISKARGPNTLKGALVTIDPANPTPLVIAFYYNPSWGPRHFGAESDGDCSKRGGLADGQAILEFPTLVWEENFDGLAA